MVFSNSAWTSISLAGETEATSVLEAELLALDVPEPEASLSGWNLDEAMEGCSRVFASKDWLAAVQRGTTPGDGGRTRTGKSGARPLERKEADSGCGVGPRVWL